MSQQQQQQQAPITARRSSHLADEPSLTLVTTVSSADDRLRPPTLSNYVNAHSVETTKVCVHGLRRRVGDERSRRGRDGAVE